MKWWLASLIVSALLILPMEGVWAADAAQPQAVTTTTAPVTEGPANPEETKAFDFSTIKLKSKKLDKPAIDAKGLSQREKVQLDILGKKRKRWDEPPDLTEVYIEKRKCSEQDIIGGVWKMIYYRETPQRHQSRMNRALRHQYITFTPSRNYARIYSRNSIDDEQQITKMLKPDMRPEFVQKWRMQEGNELLLFTGKKATRRYSCSVVKKSKGYFKADDIILVGYTSGAKSVMFELYRRW